MWITESNGQAAGTAFGKPGKKRRRAAWLIAGVLAGRRDRRGRTVAKLETAGRSNVFPAPMPFSARDIAVAPNGHTIAVIAYLESARRNALWIYELGSQSASNLADTEGANFPFWSPDNRSIAFFADGKLKKVEGIRRPSADGV